MYSFESFYAGQFQDFCERSITHTHIANVIMAMEPCKD